MSLFDGNELRTIIGHPPARDERTLRDWALLGSILTTDAFGDTIDGAPDVLRTLVTLHRRRDWRGPIFDRADVVRLADAYRFHPLTGALTYGATVRHVLETAVRRLTGPRDAN